MRLGGEVTISKTTNIIIVIDRFSCDAKQNQPPNPVKPIQHTDRRGGGGECEASPVGERARKVRFLQGEGVRLCVCVSYCVGEREGSREREREGVAVVLDYLIIRAMSEKIDGVRSHRAAALRYANAK